jgi:vacuolar-type H+-ATPase subunit I/STV1
MFFKRKALSEVTFYDWVSRLTAALEESFIEVSKSNKEDSFENVIRVFRTRTRSTLSMISGIEVRVDVNGVYTVNDFTREKMYLVTFCNGKVLELPLDEELKQVGCREYIVNLLTDTYHHHLAKLEDQEARLIREQRDVMKKKARIADLLIPLHPHDKTFKPVEIEEPNTYITE